MRPVSDPANSGPKSYSSKQSALLFCLESAFYKYFLLSYLEYLRARTLYFRVVWTRGELHIILFYQ